MNKTIGWQLRPTNTEGYVFHDGSTEIFKSGKWAFLTREVIQNSMDAIRDDEKLLKMKFSLEELALKDFPDKETLIKHIEGTLSIKGVPENCKNFSKNAINILNEEKIKILKISDYNTKGVLNSDTPGDLEGQWHALVYDEGNSQKNSDTAAGSFGLGKNAPIALSGLNMVFYQTKDYKGNYALEGVAKLHTSFINNVKYEQKIYYAKKENDSTIPLNEKEISGLPKVFTREEIGTDIIIIGVNYDEEKLKYEMIQSIVENFFVRILKEELEIEIFGVTINKSNIINIVDKYCVEPIEYTNSNIKYGYIKQYLNTYLNKYENHEYIEEVAGAGNLRLIISKDPEISGKWVAMFRSHGMKIFDLNIRTAQQNYSAIFLPNDKETDKFLRKIENPTHDLFDPEIRINDFSEMKLALERYGKIKNWIRSKIEEYTKIDITEQDFLDGMEEYIELVEDDKENSSVKKPDVEIVEFKTDLALSNAMKKGKGTSGEGEESDFEEDDQKSKKKKKFRPTDTTDEPGDDKKRIIKDYFNNFKLMPKVVAVKSKLKVAFSLDNYVQDTFNIEISSVGEDNSVSNFIPNITKAVDLTTGLELEVEENKIYNIPLSSTNMVEVIFEREFNAKYKISVYREVEEDEN